MRLVLESLRRYGALVRSDRLQLHGERVGSSFRLFYGRLSRVFRETRAPLHGDTGLSDFLASRRPPGFH